MNPRSVEYEQTKVPLSHDIAPDGIGNFFSNKLVSGPDGP
jgi:hypothetical protein